MSYMTSARKAIAAAVVFVAVSPLAGFIVPQTDYCEPTPMGNHVCGGNFNAGIVIDLSHVSVYHT